MANIIDIVVVLIIVISTLTCCLRGFVKTIFGVVGTIVAFVVAVTVGLAANEAVYNAYFKESAAKMAQNFVEQVDTGAIIEDVLKDNGVEGDIDSKELNEAIAKDGEMGDNVKAYLDEKGIETETDVDKVIDDFIKSPNISDETLEKYNIDRETVNNIMKESGEHLKEALKAAADEDKSKAADYIEENVLSPIAKRLVRDGLIIAIFILIKLIISIVIMASGVMKRFELIRKTDMIMGGLLGFFSGVVTVLVYAYIISVFITLTGGGVSPIDTQAIDNTTVFRLFYGIFR